MTISNLYEIKKSIYEKKQVKSEIICSNFSYKFVLITGGNCNIFLEEKIYKLNSEDVIIMSPGTKLAFEPSSKRPLEIFQVSITLEYLNKLSTEDIKFLNCLKVMPSTYGFITASPETLLLLRNISNTLLNTEGKSLEFAQNLYEKNLITMFIILVIRSAIRNEVKEKSKKRKASLVDELIVYIKVHITEEIPLERLEKEFFISKYHISREFKKHTGMTIHKYIVKSKLDLCKTLLEQGNSVIDVYKHCGLGGYNHMFRAFKQEFGITPMEYCKEIKESQKEM